ncbi:MAG: M20/M25/M40 family metallo-hydrolase, partial [Candidatus Eisenbacteria bacterium]|nr:M20/M25/M40 family metallo-hydrolase [Candidatus Eisenbacteria bacterium]
MYDVLTSYGLEVEFHVYQQSGPKKNVVATIPGTAHPEQVVYMTGHFDSVSPSAETSAPGADDNGSGTAAFLEAARVLAQYEFENTIKLVGFNGEEEGLVGSSAYVSAIANQGEQVIGCFNLDMVAYRGNDPGPADLYIYTDPSSLP